MDRILPQALARSGRGLCPTCGVTQKLGDLEARGSCRFCGEKLSLAYRLRAIEPGTEPNTEPDTGSSTGPSTGPSTEPSTEPSIRLSLEAVKTGDEPRASPWHDNLEAARCPECRSPFECEPADEIQTCPNCAFPSKLEYRLLRLEIVALDPPQERTREDDQNQRRGRIEHPWDVTTEQLIWRILNETDVVGRVNLARKFRDWGYINHTSAHFLPFLLRHMQGDADAVAYRIGEIVGKLLCEDGRPFNLAVIHGCETVINDPGGKRCLLDGLGLGDWICLKILLDAAQAAVERGERDHACHALKSIGTIFGRCFEHHKLMAEIVLYGMYYISGPVLGWALRKFEDGFDYGFSYPFEEFLEIMDDLLQERPQLGPALRRSCDAGPPETLELFRRRLAMIRDFVTPGARAAACEHVWYPPTREVELYTEAVGIIEAALDHPQTHEPAGLALSRLFDEYPSLPAMKDLVRRRGESLPERFRARYCRMFPDQKLIDPEPVEFWQDDHVEPDRAAMDTLVEEWQEGVSAAIVQYEKKRREAAMLLDAGDEQDLPIFTRDGPATIPLSGHA